MHPLFTTEPEYRPRVADTALPAQHRRPPSANVKLGPQALQSITTGTNDTALGYQVLKNNTTGSENTANGFQALYSNTSGNLNTGDWFWSALQQHRWH